MFWISLLTHLLAKRVKLYQTSKQQIFKFRNLMLSSIPRDKMQNCKSFQMNSVYLFSVLLYYPRCVYSLLLMHRVVEESECKNEYLTNNSFFIIIPNHIANFLETETSCGQWLLVDTFGVFSQTLSVHENSSSLVNSSGHIFGEF